MLRLACAAVEAPSDSVSQAAVPHRHVTYSAVMTSELLQQNWALLVAGVISVVVTAVVLQRLFQQSSMGQLQARVRSHRAAQKTRSSAERRVEKRKQKVKMLMSRADDVRPADLESARGALKDAEALLKIADDKLLVEANQLRKVIFEQFPPRRHEALRAQYLPDDVADGRPFSF